MIYLVIAKKSAGFSLVELLLVLLLTLFLMTGVIEIYLSMQNTFSKQTALAYIANNGRFASYFLMKNIRMAGSSFCDEQATDKNIVQGYQNHIPAFLQNQVVNNSAVLMIHSCRFVEGKERYVPTWFFVGATTRNNAAGIPVFGLYEIVNGHKQELVENITDMKLLYGIAAPDARTIQHYLVADNISEWQWVRSVKVTLILSSPAVPTKALNSTAISEKQWPFYVAIRARL